MLIACLQVEIGTGKSSRYVRKAESANLLHVWVPFHVGAIVAITYIHGVLILCGCLYGSCMGVGKCKVFPHTCELVLIPLSTINTISTMSETPP